MCSGLCTTRKSGVSYVTGNYRGRRHERCKLQYDVTPAEGWVGLPRGQGRGEDSDYLIIMLCNKSRSAKSLQRSTVKVDIVRHIMTYGVCITYVVRRTVIYK